MSFNVTQCPACESTFNTNSRVLAAAAGRVRCGACLNVFEAIDHFLVPDEADESIPQDESVFVGNDPQEFFDPSSFLTRSALNEPDPTDVARIDPIDEQHLHEELEQSETLSEDFFATVAEELQGREETPAPENTPENALEEDQTEQLEGSHEIVLDEDIDAEFEEEMLDAFEAKEPEMSDFASNELSEPPPETSTEPETVELEPIENQAIEKPARDEDTILGTGLSASFTFNPFVPAPEVRIGETAKSEGSTESEQLAAPQPESDNLRSDEEPAIAPDAEPADATDWSEPQTEQFEEPDLTTEAQIVENFDDGEGSEIDEGSEIGESSEIDEEIATEPFTVTDDTPVQDTKEPETEIRNLDLHESASLDPLVEPELDADSNFANPDEPNEHSETAEDQGIAELTDSSQEDMTDDSEEAEEEASTTSQVEDDQSTEAIRARALETELSDEEALEAIPQENLAALGKMSTPVELLARKESRLLRSALLFVGILLLSGLLSAQYLWKHLDVYSQLAQLRPLYAFACTYLDCQLSEFTDIDSIRSENLTVQSHPTVENGLMVNTIIRNTAGFEQAFPILILSFNSAENSVVALREFTPAEYLDPGLRSIPTMPVMTPVQIGLAIMDPGPGAVNYTLAFRWP